MSRRRQRGFTLLEILVALTVLAVTLAVVVLRLFAGWILALPLVLFEGLGGRAALAASMKLLPASVKKAASRPRVPGI